MRTIQEVGLEILNHNPKSLYILCGSEYGIKRKYIQELISYYKNYKQYDHVSEVIDLLSTKHLIALPPTVYLVKYDLEFISGLDSSLALRLTRLKFKGTIVLVYQEDKQLSKLSKYLDAYTVSIDEISAKYIHKYIHTDFPQLNSEYIDLVTKCSSNYSQAYMLASCLSVIDDKVDTHVLETLFKDPSVSTESMLRIGIASRNFKYCVDIISRYESLDNVYYTFLQVLLDIEKCQSNSYTQSDVQKYIKMWTRKDIYCMFDNVYDQLKKSRTYTIDISNSVIYLLSLLTFKEIPQKESLSV